MSNQSKPRLLGLLLVATLVVLVGDLSGHPAAEAIRSAAGTVVGPAQRFLAGVRPAQVAQLSAENAELRAEADRLSRQLHVQSQLEELVGAGVVKGRTAVIGQVVASEVSAVGGRSLTLDVGSHDGVVVDSTVVSAAGLVGRVVAVAPWTCDVQLLGAAQSVVAVRVGERGLLGTVAPVPVGGGDDSTQLALTLAQPGNPHVGDRVTTLGSVGGRPYAPGITLGRVVSVDPDRGRDTVTGRVVPAVDRESIDVVAVLIPEARAQPRPVVGDRTGEEPRVG
ncbi:rod shape-determining protein MreC [Intrasporangium calvum]|uniref:Cell shape-determining protein MreC n=1 Tax=Intrasporangium calvum (strain ATCC 23552 / DSM 43043 / JCM 3097 / NBRC 12989 / NCIMB 10167 / NRRL B-3866 / 7 KIP) TaxID=710696 RepID=E6SE68_INTC7|nr:rod shape-determining protein MreC [Intrasporangium calvum]ADU48716.1 Rod shape-determining protein MreC [Intrasporangium calvum DSM 43043]AXG13706.1 rod shape-determining protein MreC [Intrasporangium calvum]